MTVEAGPARLARARALLDVGRFEAARREVMALLAEESHNPEALCLLAHTYQAEDDFAAMRDAARRAVEADPEHQNGHVLLAFALVGLNDWAAARASALEGIRLQPEDWHGHSALATAELGLGHPRLALRTAAHAVGLAPQQPGPHFIRGLLYDAIEFKRKARKSYRQTLALDPQHIGALTRLGRLAVGGQRLSEAAGHLGAALSAAPTDDGARTQLDRLILFGLGGWAIMAVWTAGVLGLFTMFPWMWAAVLLLPVAWCVWAARTWRSLSPGLRAYARQMLRFDARARVRLAVLAVCALTAAGLAASGSAPGPDGDPPVWLLIPACAHLLSLLAAGVAILIVDHRVAGPQQVGPRDVGAASAPTDMLAEHRRAAPAGRLVLRTFRTGALLAFVPWLLSIDPPAAWPVRAPVALAALAALAGYGWWVRRRLLRRPGPLNPALGVLLLPMTLGLLAELLVLGAAAALPTAALPLPDAVVVPGFLAIAAGVVAWIGGLGYAAVAGAGRLLRHGRADATPAAQDP
ncbi:tetratricopeptide repeat protein [Dactylosporangium sp. NPDC000521]|uniref:tetratricopeptide repeat protein n=1 Tax=Dactylosporangium sp. NPDC000521 TaxID=3363975 RepID=UPI003676CBD6